MTNKTLLQTSRSNDIMIPNLSKSNQMFI